MTPPKPLLTEEECDRLDREAFGDSSQLTGECGVEHRLLAQSAAALGARKQRERDAEYMRSSFGRCNLLRDNGYLNGDDIAKNIEADGEET